MSRVTALVVIVALGLAAGRSGHPCVGDTWESRHCVAVHQSILACAERDSRPREPRLESGCRVRQAIEQGMPGDTGAALAPPTYRLPFRVDVHTPRRSVEERVPLERRPLSTNLRI